MIPASKLSLHRSFTRFMIVAITLLLLASLVIPANAQSEHIVVAKIKGPVTPAMANYFDRAIATAEESGAMAALLILDTPGGSVEITLEIVQSFLNASVPVIVYIGPAGAQAASAGSIITAAAHAAGMAPDTVIGGGLTG